jgi:hypothetical protein
MTSLQDRILKYAASGMLTRNIAKTVKCCETHVRNTLRKARQQKAASKKTAAKNAFVPTPTTKPKANHNGHLTVAGIRDRAKEYFKKAADLERAADLLESADFLP